MANPAPRTGAAPEDILAWEAEQRPRAAIAAIVAGLLVFAGMIVTAITFRHHPAVTLFDALRDATGRPPESGGLLTKTALFRHDHVLGLTGGQVLSSVGGVLAAGAVLYLYIATRARATVNQVGLVALIAGGIAYFVGTIVSEVAVDISISDFVGSSDHSTAAAHDALQPSLGLVGALIAQVGTLALALGIVVVSMNAMKVGLLTRFLGVLGILAGVLFVIFRQPIILAFWLVAIGMLYLQRTPSGVPPAWTSGLAIPWPSRQQVIEQARAESGEEPSAATDSGDDEELGLNGSSAHPRSKKKKRRR